MTVQSVIDAITGGGSQEDIATAVSQQWRYDASEVAEILHGITPEGKAEREKAKKAEAEEKAKAEAQAQHQSQAARGTATTQSQAQHEGARHAPARDA